MDYERYITLLVIDLIRDPSPKGLLTCRVRLYDLMVNCVPADVVVKKIASEVLARILPAAETVKHEVVTWAAHYEHRMQLGSKELFHLEALCARLMAVLKASPSSLSPTAKDLPQEWSRAGAVLGAPGGSSSAASSGSGAGAGAGAGAGSASSNAASW